jgi:hypothetical protein
MTFVRDTKSLELFEAHISLKQNLHWGLMKNFQKIQSDIGKFTDRKKDSDTNEQKSKRPLVLNVADLEIISKAMTDPSPLNFPSIKHNILNTTSSKTSQTLVLPSLTTNKSSRTTFTKAQSLQELESRRIIPKRNRNVNRTRVLWKHEQIQNEIQQISMEIKLIQQERLEAMQSEILTDEDETFNFVRGKSEHFKTEEDDIERLRRIKSKTDFAQLGKSKVPSIENVMENDVKNSFVKFKSPTTRVVKSLKLDQLIFKTPIDRILTTTRTNNTQATPSSFELEFNELTKNKILSIPHQKSLTSFEEHSIPSFGIKSGETPNSMYDRIKFMLKKS